MESPSVIYRRRMIRRYTAEPVAPQTIGALLDAATRAPSPHNRQPWRFAVVSGAMRQVLARVMGDQLRADLSRDGVAAELIAADVEHSYQRITGAPISILACLSMRDMDRYPDDRRNEAEHWMAVQATSAATQNILLRATEFGLGACWMCAPLFCQRAVVQALKLPDEWEPQALITVGYPADSGRNRPRIPWQDVTLFIPDRSSD